MIAINNITVIMWTCNIGLFGPYIICVADEMNVIQSLDLRQNQQFL